MTHGRDLAGLEPSTYLRVLDLLLIHGYPLATFMPLGVGRRIVGGDALWLYQPTMAVMAAMLALALYELTSRLIASRPLRAVVALVAAQSALLYGYALWGGIKELGTAWAVPLLAAVVPLAVRSERLRQLLPLAVVTALLFGVLNAGALPWVAPALLFAAVAIFRRQRRRRHRARRGRVHRLHGRARAAVAADDARLPALEHRLVRPAREPRAAAHAAPARGHLADRRLPLRPGAAPGDARARRRRDRRRRGRRRDRRTARRAGALALRRRRRRERAGAEPLEHAVDRRQGVRDRLARDPARRADRGRRAAAQPPRRRRGGARRRARRRGALVERAAVPRRLARPATDSCRSSRRSATTSPARARR